METLAVHKGEYEGHPMKLLPKNKPLPVVLAVVAEQYKEPCRYVSLKASTVTVTKA